MSERNCTVEKCCGGKFGCQLARPFICDKCHETGCYGVDGKWLCTGHYVEWYRERANAA